MAAVEIAIKQVPSTAELVDVWEGQSRYQPHQLSSIQDYLRNDWQAELDLFLGGNEILCRTITERYGGKFGMNVSNVWHQWVRLLGGATASPSLSEWAESFYPVVPVKDTLAFKIATTGGTERLMIIDLQTKESIVEEVTSIHELVAATDKCREETVKKIRAVLQGAESPIHADSLDFDYFLPRIERVSKILDEGKFVPGTRLVRSEKDGVEVEGKLDANNQVVDFYPTIKPDTLRNS